MSSRYDVICISHDPAIVIDTTDERGVAPNSPDFALAALADRTHGPAQGHPKCDLVVGRFSHPLIEVCCPASRSNGVYHGSSHRDDQWVQASWLRLLLLGEPDHAETARLPSCWTWEMAYRLRDHLGIEVSRP